MAEIISLAYPTTSSLKDPATIQSMKLRVLKIIILAAAVSSGSALLLLSRKTPDTSSIPDVTPTSTPAVVAAENEAPPEKMPVEQPAFPVKKTVLNNKQPEEKPDPQKMPVNQHKNSRQQYWETVIGRFNRQKERLDSETDQTKRSRIIKNAARHVRFDTLNTIEWAISLESEEEQKMAIEAINRNALTGIGARIATDETGYPCIRDMTVLGAMETSGAAQTGDHILGIENESGQWVSFEDMPMPEIISMLRGEAGSEVRLLMQNTESVYEITTQRSLIVIQPPL